MSRSSPARRQPPHNHGSSTPPPRPPQPQPPALLPPVSLLDCVVFCVCLAPQLLLQAGPWATFACILRALPFLAFRMPVDVARRQWTARRQRQRQRPSIFEDIVLCCVRWAFVHMPPRVGRVFFSRPVALPFFQFRQLRHDGVWRTFRAAASYMLSLLTSLRGVSLWSISRSRKPNDQFSKGIWISHDETQPADIVIFFVHGGGFVLGSSHFYLEFLRTWMALLLGDSQDDKVSDKKPRFYNPAFYSLDYTLAPDAVFPTQLDEALQAYDYVVTTAAQDSSTRVVVAGDSAGGAIVLSLLLRLSQKRQKRYDTAPPLPRMPDQAILISPWVSLWSQRYRRSANDYIDAASLAGYAAQYVGSEATAAELAANPKRVDPLLSPGHCHDGDWWRRASPSRRLFVTYGEEEVFAPEIRAWAEALQADGVSVQTSVDPGGLGVHAWPVASLFLARTNARRFEGLRRIVEAMRV
ncbi:hypothetical protein SBRCBS47491_004146 [Sporothrix bragantina]|uniref:Alpha/beta hydrolase fold-3 domain-containing protein n=1 Tax=Sporothrix bragantina TaxID=671064 RepID=A0ABP0BLD1_9PEZI